jgi:hypothetical protein
MTRTSIARWQKSEDVSRETERRKLEQSQFAKPNAASFRAHHCEERSDQAIQTSSADKILDCFAYARNDAEA